MALSSKSGHCAFLQRYPRYLAKGKTNLGADRPVHSSQKSNTDRSTLSASYFVHFLKRTWKITAGIALEIILTPHAARVVV